MKSFSFFQLVSLLERLYSRAAPVGHAGPANKELLRFHSDTSLAFPSSDISDFAEDGSAARFRMVVTFLGLHGSVYPLPTFYAEDILQSDDDDKFVEKFLDVFHHRLISLFYRAWLKYRYHAQFALDGKDPFSTRLFSLMGLRAAELRQTTGLGDTALLRY